MAETISELKVAIGADISRLEGQLSKMEKSIKGAGERSSSSFKSAMGGVAGTLAAVFSVQAIISFQKQVIELGSEFQKFSAILNVSLGDSSLAAGAMAMIQDFAAKTPFSVRELTDSFVKLTNQGFKPNARELTKLGDLAASKAKSFSQLSEALIDAQVGEFERLKEFGIISRTEGNKVKFTFNEITTEVDKTSESIKDYILSLGGMDGISGSMSAISKTLGGELSNLGDAFDQLLVSISETEGGLLHFFTKVGTVMLQGLTADIQAGGMISGDSQALAQSAGDITFKATIDQFSKLESKYGSTELALDALKKKSKEYQDLSNDDNSTAKMSYYYLKQAEAMNKALLELSSLNTTTEEGKGNLDEQAKALEKWTAKVESASIAARELESTILDGMFNFDFKGLAFGGQVGDVQIDTSLMQPVGMDLEEGEALPGAEAFAESLSRQQEAFNFMQSNAQMLGGAFQSAFDAALISGESFTETLGKSLEGLLQKLVSAAITASALSLIFSGFGVGSFAGNFKSFFGQFGGFEFGLDGNNLLASGNRTQGQNNRVQ